jgi:hypothetical protein
MGNASSTKAAPVPTGAAAATPDDTSPEGDKWIQIIRCLCAIFMLHDIKTAADHSAMFTECKSLVEYSTDATVIATIVQIMKAETKPLVANHSPFKKAKAYAKTDIQAISKCIVAAKTAAPHCTPAVFELAYIMNNPRTRGQFLGIITDAFSVMEALNCEADTLCYTKLNDIMKTDSAILRQLALINDKRNIETVKYVADKLTISATTQGCGGMFILQNIARLLAMIVSEKAKWYSPNLSGR